MQISLLELVVEIYRKMHSFGSFLDTFMQIALSLAAQMGSA